MSATTEDRIDVQKVSVAFDGGPGREVLAIDRVDFRAARGEFVALIGPSGCGKSTLLNVIGGLVGATSGAALVDSERIRAVPKQVGYMFQKDTLLPWATVLKNVLLPLKLRKAVDTDRARKLLESMGLSGFEESFPHELSGGMRTRVELARLLLQDPEIILMDEPFGALDAQMRLIMQEEFLKHWAEHLKTVVLVTHDLQEALLMADRVVLMSARPGRIKADYHVPLDRPRSVEDIGDDPEYRRLFAEIWHSLREELHGHATGGQR